MSCPNCERYKKSAAMWRNKAYEASGHPLPWKPDELWKGLSDQEVVDLLNKYFHSYPDLIHVVHMIEAILKEKNG